MPDSGRVGRPITERILNNITINEWGCWEWNLSRSRAGYGHIDVGSRRDGSSKTKAAHRVSYEAFVGPIPDGLTLDHECENTCCVNPQHLTPLTLVENIKLSKRSASAANRRKESCPKCGGAYTATIRSTRVCVSCRTEYMNAYNAARRTRRQPLKPCGTASAARRHQNSGEPLCDPCRVALAEYRRNLKRGRNA